MKKFVNTLLPPFLVRDTLARLDIEIVSEQGDEYWALCPMHYRRTGKQDKHPSWSINTETGLNSCFSCHYRANLYVLVRDLKGRSVAAALRRGEALAVSDKYRVDRSTAFPKPDAITVKGMPDSELALFDEPPTMCIEHRGLTKWAVDLYGVRWDRNNRWWIFPLRDPSSGMLIGYQEKGEYERYFRNVPAGMDKGSTLFGYHEMKGVPEDRVIVVESPMDAVLLHGFGYPAVALGGSRLSDAQSMLLQEFGFVVFALDNDDAGKLESARIKREFSGTMFSIAEYKVDAKDVGTMLRTDIDEMVRASGF